MLPVAFGFGVLTEDVMKYFGEFPFDNGCCSLVHSSVTNGIFLWDGIMVGVASTIHRTEE